MTVNIKVASKCRAEKKENGIEGHTKTASTKYRNTGFRFVNSICSMIQEGALFYAACFPTDFISLDQVSVYICASHWPEKSVHYSFLHILQPYTSTIYTDINKMSAPEHDNNGEFRAHRLCVMMLGGRSDFKLMLLFADTT